MKKQEDLVVSKEFEKIQSKLRNKKINEILLVVIVLGLCFVWLNKPKVNSGENHIVNKTEPVCPPIKYGEYKNPQTGEVKNFEGCNKPEYGWEKVYTKAEIDLLTKQKQLRESNHQKAIADYQIESKKKFEQLLKVYTGLPIPIENDQIIQGYERVLVSHSGNSELYVLNTYSKLLEEVNEYAGHLGIKEIIYFECKKNTGYCQRSLIIEKAKEAKLQNYFSGIHNNVVESCFLGWDAENERIYKKGCGLSWVYGFTQFNYGENKYFLKAASDNVMFLGINKQLSQYAVVENSNFGSSSTGKTFPNKILLYLTNNPARPNKIIDVSGIVDLKSDLNSIESFSWDTDGDSAHFTFQNKNYYLDAKAGLLK
jgi:hypothetical protein